MMPRPSKRRAQGYDNEPQLKVVSTQTSDQGTNTTESTYTTDGKECVNKGFMDSEMKSTAKWDGDVLVIDSKMDMQGNAITITNRWTLSGDGKGLTVAMHFASPMGDGDVKMVYEKK